MTEQQIIEIWQLFRDLLDKKQVTDYAEKYINLLLEFEIEEKVLEDLIGADPAIDEAVAYYLELEEDDDDDDDYDYDDED